MNPILLTLFVGLAVCALAVDAGSQKKPRARDIGIPFDGTPGANNAITDVKGVEVGYVTLISGEGKLVVGRGPVRTGVTAILPRGRSGAGPVAAGTFVLNGNGEMTGTIWLQESGLLDGPVMITNTHSVGVVRDAVIAWRVNHHHADMEDSWSLPVVAETYDGWLNDINGFHVKPEHVFKALESATGGPIAEGNVGGGTGMMCHGFKGGTGTASRKTEQGYTVGVLVQANHGSARRLTIAGVPVGAELMRWSAGSVGSGSPPAARSDSLPGDVPGESVRQQTRRTSSIIIIIATDAPLVADQLRGLARRAALGVGRVGGLGEVSSGDIFLAFSTGNNDIQVEGDVAKFRAVIDDQATNGLYEAVVEATEEAIINALVAAETMVGRDNHTVKALPHDRVREILKQYNRLKTP